MLATTRAEGAEHYSVLQVFELLCLLAAADTDLPRGPLRDFVLAGPVDDIGTYCMEPLVRLEGLDALVACFGRCDAESILDDAWAYAQLPGILAERDGNDSAAEALRQARAQNSAFDRLPATAESAVEPKPQPEIEHSYAAVKAQISAGASWPGASWREWAAPEDLAAAAADLLAERDEKRLFAYLPLFFWRDFPCEPRSLFHLLDSANRRIQFHTIKVLSRLRHPDVRALALDLIARGPNPDWGVQLLVSNSQTGDFALVAPLLAAAVGHPNAYHALECSVRRVLDCVGVTEAETRHTLLHM